MPFDLHSALQNAGTGKTGNQYSNMGNDMASQNDMKMAETTYAGFISFVKWGTISTVIIAALVILLIA